MNNKLHLFKIASITCLLLIGFGRHSLAQNVRFEWAKKFGTAEASTATALDVDAAGNVYITGAHTPDAYETFGKIFVAKFDGLGNFIWEKQIVSADGAGMSNAIKVDTSGHIYITGSFYGTVDFNPGNAIVDLTSAFTDIFVCKLDTAGNLVWAKQMGGAEYDMGNSIAVDGLGNVYTTGYFSTSGDFDPGTGVQTLTATTPWNPLTTRLRDVFVSKLDANGNFVWAKSMGGNVGDEGRSIAVDDAGNVYTTGFYGNLIAGQVTTHTADFI